MDLEINDTKRVMEVSKFFETLKEKIKKNLNSSTLQKIPRSFRPTWPKFHTIWEIISQTWPEFYPNVGPKCEKNQQLG